MQDDPPMDVQFLDVLKLAHRRDSRLHRVRGIRILRNSRTSNRVGMDRAFGVTVIGCEGRSR